MKPTPLFHLWKDDPVGELLKVASHLSDVRKTNAVIDNG